jgi:DNA-binding IclR family transcriptional regulator
MKQVTNRSLHRGLLVMEVLAAAAGPMRLTDVATSVELDKATTLRLINTLRAAGYVEQDGDQGRYYLTPRVWRLTRGDLRTEDLRQVARPELEALRDETGETVHLGMLLADQIVYIDKLETTHSIRLVSAIGQSQPLHTTGLGKALLAFLPPEKFNDIIGGPLAPRTEHSLTTGEAVHEDCEGTRERGYSIEICENQDDVVCVGAPILGADGYAVATLSIAGPAFRLRQRIDELGPLARRAGDAIADRLRRLESGARVQGASDGTSGGREPALVRKVSNAVSTGEGEGK